MGLTTRLMFEGRLNEARAVVETEMPAADIYQWNLMRRLCETSAEQRSMMGDMTEAGVNPDCATYTILAKQLMFEGRLDEARAVVETEMPAAGIEPNDRTHALLGNLRRSGVG